MKQKLLLIIAVVFGLLAFFLTYQQLEAEKRRIDGDAEHVVLIKFTRNMAEGDEITAADVERYEIKRKQDKQMLSRDVLYSELHMVVGRKLATSVAKGQILQSTDLQSPTPRNSFNNNINRSMRAISLPVDPVSSVNYLIQPLDNVDVIGTFRFPNAKGSELETVTMTILQDVKVLAVGNRWGKGAIDPYGNRNYGTITLEVYPAEVEMLVFASPKGSLSVALRKYNDSVIERDVEKRQVNFNLLQNEIPKYNEQRRQMRLQRNSLGR